jgi:hypothetical protein
MELGIDELTHALPTSADLLDEPNRTAYLESWETTDSKFAYRWFELVDYDSEPFRRMLSMLVEKDIHVDLTLVASELGHFYDRIDELEHDPLEHAYPDPAFLENWRQRWRTRATSTPSCRTDAAYRAKDLIEQTTASD